jgi:hypothetical protein
VTLAVASVTKVLLGRSRMARHYKSKSWSATTLDSSPSATCRGEATLQRETPATVGKEYLEFKIIQISNEEGSRNEGRLINYKWPFTRSPARRAGPVEW